MKTCKIEGCENKVWSKNLCLIHTPKKPLKKGKHKPLKKSWLSKQPTEKGLLLKEKKKELTALMKEEFLKFYNNHTTKRCFECNKYINEDSFGIINVHHILPKSKYPQYYFEHWNYCLLCGNCHSQVELNIDLAPKVKELTKELKLKYG